MFAAFFALALAASAPDFALTRFDEIALAPDGRNVASIEHEQRAGEIVVKHLMIRASDGRVTRDVPLPCAGTEGCDASGLAWSRDAKHLVFVLRDPRVDTHALESVDADGTNLHAVVTFKGDLHAPSWSPDGGTLAVLATAGAAKEVGANQAGAPQVGEIGAHTAEQRIAVVAADGTLRMVSPADLYVYEYDWLPGGRGFAGTAAHGNGDNNWWVARLYAFDPDGTARELFAPASPQLQMADPRVSPDGTQVAFIGGLMSDFGATGGDVYVVPASGGAARDLTPNMPASATSVWWNCGPGSNVAFTAIRAPHGFEVDTVDANPGANGAVTTVHSFGAALAIRANETSDLSHACGSGTYATVRQGFAIPPEIALGPLEAMLDLTRINRDAQPETVARQITWKSDGNQVDGYLLAPLNYNPRHTYAMVTDVHGGPAWSWRPDFVGPGERRELLRRGYYVFLPNPRGSYGHGEAFTLGNVKDFGGGDLRDILSGVDAAERAAPIDDKRLGIEGASYGGYMTMFAITQTHRFGAAAADAGVSNFQSYYGENGIDEWMIPYFGASVYDDPAVYAKSSPIDFVKNVKTPTLITVGEHDIETPAAQSLEFWHALVTFGVPTQLVIYPGEGHQFRIAAHRADLERRTLDWFERYLP